MDKKQKIFIGIGVFIFVVLIGFISYKFMSTPSLEDQSKNKSSDSKPALETNVDNASNEKNAKEEKQKQQASKEKKEKEDKSNEKDKKNKKENKSKEEEPKKKPDKKDLEKKAKRFVEIQNESKTPDNVKSLKSDMNAVATSKLTNKLFNDHMSADEDSHFKAKVTKTNIIKDGKKNAEVNVKYDLHGKSPETKKQEKLKENIEESVYFKYEDGQYKVDRYKQ